MKRKRKCVEVGDSQYGTFALSMDSLPIEESPDWGVSSD